MNKKIDQQLARTDAQQQYEKQQEISDAYKKLDSNLQVSNLQNCLKDIFEDFGLEIKEVLEKQEKICRQRVEEFSKKLKTEIRCLHLIQGKLKKFDQIVQSIHEAKSRENLKKQMDDEMFQIDENGKIKMPEMGKALNEL